MNDYLEIVDKDKEFEKRWMQRATPRQDKRYVYNENGFSSQEGVYENDKNNNFERLMLDKNSKGFQILREYVNYFGFNFNAMCQSLDADNRLAISKEDFRNILSGKKSEFYFTSENVEDILTDSPHLFDGKNYFILYNELYNSIIAFPPKTKLRNLRDNAKYNRYCLANIWAIRNKQELNDNEVEKWEKEIERMKSNFWDRREPGQEWDFEFSGLDRLELFILRTPSQEGADTKDNTSKRDLTENELYEKSVKNLYILNNETILKNFDTRVALLIAKLIKPPNVLALTDEQLEKIFQMNFQGSFKQDVNKPIRHWFEQDFIQQIFY